MRRAKSWPSQAVAGLIGGYQRRVSPLFAPRCRFYPSCSNYAAEAVATHGLMRGGAMAMWRLARCQPFSAGGVDYVPARVEIRWRGAER
ncbi:MAG: membrane protein insertion efficiency factor YidD [Bifidobacteriaceae bacterium]|jgi:putative membrane protein insertion efficiency factor|nr:membrane protein insertion efficiency factor YidD [Bifidobacteriaceae bacterium]